MLRSIDFIRPATRLVALISFLPASVATVACSGGTDGGTFAGGAGLSGAGGLSGVEAGAGSSGTGGAGSSGTGGAGSSGTGGAGGSGGMSDEEGGSDAAAAVPDTTAPTVVSTDPDRAATGAGAQSAVTVTFDEAMAPASITDATFTLKHGTTEVDGEVTYFNKTATFVPAAALLLGTIYTASIAATDVAGHALATPYTWTFTTDTTAPLGPAPVLLGAAGKYVIVAKAAIANVPTSAITGNLALSPAAATYITGFALTRAGTKWTSPQVTGGIFAANNDPPTPTDLTTSVANMETAYTDAAGRPTPQFTNLGQGAIGGLTLAPGLYKWTTAVTIPTDVTIAGAPNDVWIFQISGDLTMSVAKRMTLTGGARAKNVFWQVAGKVDLGTTSHAEGIILSKTAINLGSGASINGRLLAQTAVNIASSTITAPSP